MNAAMAAAAARPHGGTHGISSNQVLHGHGRGSWQIIEEP